MSGCYGDKDKLNEINPQPFMQKNFYHKNKNIAGIPHATFSLS